jgi:dTMP kinase
MLHGKYIVIEGLDGSGKTTQHKKLLEYLGETARGVREPGGTPMGEAIRTIVKDASLPRLPRTNVYLFSAARVELIDEVIRPAITAGQHVVADRNWLSTVAIQSSEGVENIDEIYQLCKLATGEFFVPDLLIFIDTDVSSCRQRLTERGNTKADYFDELGENYFTRVREAYLKHVKELPHYTIVDGNTTPGNVHAAIRNALQDII